MQCATFKRNHPDTISAQGKLCQAKFSEATRPDYCLQHHSQLPQYVGKPTTHLIHSFGDEPMKRLIMTIGCYFVALFLMSCANIATGGKETMERVANSKIGQVPQDAFRYAKGVTCSTIDGEQGCLMITSANCRVWFSVSESTKKIVAWRYAGDTANCWRLVSYG